MLVPRQEYSRELKIAAMREIDSGKGMAEVARMYQLSPKRLETWRSEWRAKGELAFPGKGAQPQPRLDAEQPPDLPPVSLMDMGFAIIGSLARHRRPHIRFLFIGSCLCSTLLSGPASRRVLFHPCVSLTLRLHQTG
jgi:hypothetical protein